MTAMTDPIGDLLARIRNAQHARQDACLAPHSRVKLQLCEILKNEGWISNVEVLGDDPKKTLKITFNPEKMTLELTRISKPGRRVYKGVADLQPVLRGFGIAILTTSQGLMTDKQAREKGVGGEILCTIS